MEELNQKTLREKESLCIQEQPPYCMSQCPLHVDGRALCSAIMEGNFTKARGILEKNIVFPRIIAAVCEAPCQKSCRRNEVGEGIQIRLLEKASMSYGKAAAAKKFFLPKKTQRAAIIGGSLSGLAAAVELARKGYQVTVMEAGEQVGGRVLQLANACLSAQDIAEDFMVLERLSIVFKLQQKITAKDLGQLLAEYDAVYIVSGALNGFAAEGIDCANDPQTLMTNQEKLFAGSAQESGSSYIGDLSDGKRAAISIDRFLQRASLTNARECEGAFPSKLYTSLEGVSPAAAIQPQEEGFYSESDAIAEARRCLQCQCLECVKGCAYLRHYKRYPKMYVREIFNNMSIVMGIHGANGFINSCALCGQCKVICPHDFDLGEICKMARSAMVAKGKMPPSTHDFALMDMAFSNGDEYFTVRHQPGTAQSAYVLFPGCQMGASMPDLIQNVYQDLCQRLEGGVGLILGCCGAIADWAGNQPSLFHELDKIKAAWETLGRPQMITMCPSCQRTFEQYGEMEPVSIVQILASIGLPVQMVQGDGVLAVHDSCTTRYDRNLQDEVRALAHQCGYTLEELPYSREKTHCCGYGGLASLANREVGREMVAQCIGQSGRNYLTYCVNCRDSFMLAGKETRHILELVYGFSAHPVPDISKRRVNRILLKQQLLKEIWGEEMEQTMWQGKCYISEEVQQRMNDRMILITDLQQVLVHAEETQQIIYHQEQDFYSSSHRIGNVTFWVEFQKVQDGYRILNAYSHRMDFEEGENNGAIL